MLGDRDAGAEVESFRRPARHTVTTPICEGPVRRAVRLYQGMGDLARAEMYCRLTML